MTIRRALLAAAALMLALALPAGAQDAAVEVVDNAYEPETITVTVGETVTWTHTGANPHTVTASDGSFDSHPDCESFTDPCMQSGDTYEQTFDEVGEIPYYCKLHGSPDGQGMAGTIQVVAAQEEPTSSPEPTATETEPPATVTGSISVSDQSDDGTTVTVDSVTIEGASGFVVVHADADGAPGAVIGHTPIDEGTTTGLEVPFDQPLSSPQTVWPMLHVDAGEVGVYEFPGPDGPVTADGNVVVKPLEYTVVATAAEEPAPAPEEGTEGELARTGLPVLLLAVLAAGVLGGGAAIVRRRNDT